MHDGVRQRSARPRGAGGNHVRPLLAGLALLAVFVGVRSGPHVTWSGAWDGPWHDRGHGIAVLAGLELVFACLLVALRIRARRTPEPGWPAAPLRAALLRVIALAMVIPLVALIGLFHLPKPRRRPRPLVPTQRPGRPLGRVPRPGQVSPHSAEIARYVLLALLAIAVFAAAVLLLRRLRSAAPAPELLDEPDDAAALRQAVEAGRLARGARAAPRMAIINCYLAMERSLAAAGTSRAGPETPQELLARSRTAGLLRTAAADELTSLFYAARFSTHAVSPATRDQAQRALDEIAAELAGATTGLAAAP